MSDGPVGLLSVGAYLPVRRLARATIAAAHGWTTQKAGRPPKGERTVASWDEDAVTMAVEAARVALEGRDPPAAVTLASTSLPFADRLNSGIVAAGLDLGRETQALDLTGSLRAGTSALIAALEAPARPGGRLVVASEHRRAKPGSALEGQIGDAAAGCLVGAGDLVAELLGSISLTADFVDHHRAADRDTDYVLEERWLRDAGAGPLINDAVSTLLTRIGLAAGEIDRAIVGLGGAGLKQAVARRLTLADAAIGDPIEPRTGFAGAAQPLLDLAQVLETARPGQTILVIGFGQGVDAILLRATGKRLDAAASVSAQLAAGRAEDSYLRFASFAGQIDYDWGIRAERDNRTAQTVAWRKHRDVYGFVGGRCRTCGCVQFPLSHGCVNPNCRALDSQEPCPLGRTTGTIKTFTEDWQAFTPEPPLRYGNIDLPGGGNILMELADCPEAPLAIGQRVRMAFRIKDLDDRRGFRRYFWKAVPLSQESLIEPQKALSALRGERVG